MGPPRKVTPMDQGPSLKITLAEHSSTGLVQVDGAKSKRVMSAVDLVNALSDGIQSRTVHATKMNSESSRSHLVMGVTITTTNKRTGASTTGKLTLVDLAGSERVERSGAEGQQLKEAAAINKSLSALGDVINALTSAEGGHVPYRNHPSRCSCPIRGWFRKNDDARLFVSRACERRRKRQFLPICNEVQGRRVWVRSPSCCRGDRETQSRGRAVERVVARAAAEPPRSKRRAAGAGDAGEAAF